LAVSVKLDALLEERLRRRAAAAGCTASDVIRSALRAYLAEPSGEQPSAFSLGADLFGRFQGAPGLAQDRKRLLADIWALEHGCRGT